MGDVNEALDTLRSKACLALALLKDDMSGQEREREIDVIFQAQKTIRQALERQRDCVPTNWCDPLLTGSNAVVTGPPFDCGDIERLLNAIRERLTNTEANDG